MIAKDLTFYGNDKEDRFIYENFGLIPDNGVFVDVGAGDGITGSNTYFFEKNGWSGLAIDADPRNVEKLQKTRKIGIGALVSNKVGKQTFYMAKSTPDISGIIKTPDNNSFKANIEPVKLEKILSDNKIGEIDLLSIDTEGSEIDVFESMNWQKHKPKLLIIEVVTQGKFNDRIKPYFEERGYHMYAEVGANMIFALKKPIVRDSHLIIYGSSYDRGLEHLLKMWPDIKKEVPDARLNIFYGWNLFDLGYHDNPERMAWKDKINELMKQEGITHLGRVSHQECINQNKMAGIWAYPTHFGEISCITGMRAQTYGAIPVVVNYAALKETVQYGIKIDGDIYDPETKDLFKKELIGLLKDEKHQEEIRGPMMRWAQENFSWSKVARQWNDEFLSEIPPEDQAMKLILQDEPLEALKLLPDGELKTKLLKKLNHIFNPEKYKEKYANDPMNWKPGEVDYPRHKWILEQAKDAKSLIDLGCYEGSLVSKFKGAKGVEMCKAAVADCKKRGLNVVEGDATTYQDGKKYDAVCACEIIEHVPDPQKLIDNMLSLVSDSGWCYVTTPNGCYDAKAPLDVWNNGDALIDHVRTYTPEKVQELLRGMDYEIGIQGKELYFKFRKSLERQVEALMEDNQALKAWDLVKDTNSPLKDKVWPIVRHAFDPEAYKKYYSEDLVENPVDEEHALDCTRLYPRCKWLVEDILKKKYKSVVDLGCADGYISLTLANKGLECYGVNLFKPSVDIATERAEKFKLNAKFEAKDLFDVEKKADAVILFEVLEHLPNPEEAIKKSMSLVKKGGSFYLSTPSPDHIGITLHKQENHGPWDNGEPAGHLRIYTEKELRELLKNYKIRQLLIDSQGCFLVEVTNK